MQSDMSVVKGALSRYAHSMPTVVADQDMRELGILRHEAYHPTTHQDIPRRHVRRLTFVENEQRYAPYRWHSLIPLVRRPLANKLIADQTLT